MKTVKKLLWWLGFFWILILSGGTFFQYYDLQHKSEFLQIKQQAVKTGWYLPAFYFHIIASSVLLIVGFFQFSKKVYNNRSLHKLLGKVYVISVLFISAPGAYVMTLFINRGSWVSLSFFVQNTLWVVFTTAAWLYIKKGDVNSHVKMMRRSYTLAFAAVTLRLYIFLFTVFGDGVGFENNYIIIAFASWIPNLLLVEVINIKKEQNIFAA
ncbi:DUF2306 domain-containing protein [Mucilaginibacter auburnensis]|uniref:Putative membrane protein n=1 Tax=Mucilaginibacter auburnensis TaxID=1457233 RepID=A0A2H9VL89_9SPHI|nr:DUF2306 domain-containing protein [Mucilaginibacter auburnensis]PJJ79111.1 putative membrane protein [Mucilaginibacter auburnensis]